MFAFTLQTVLDHRQFLEDAVQRELAEARRRLSTARRQLELLKGTAMDTAERLKNEQRTGLSSDQVVAYHDYFQRLYRQVSRQAAVIAEMVQQEAELERALGEAVKRRQVLEKLREQGLDRYNRKVMKKEMAILDEVAIQQFARRNLETEGGAT